MSSVIDHFLEYVKIDTQSCEELAEQKCPTTDKQYDLAHKLLADLKAMGMEEDQLFFDTEHCYVYAGIPATPGYEKVPKLGFISHMDTSPAVSGNNVTPRMIANYDGTTMLLNSEL